MSVPHRLAASIAFAAALSACASQNAGTLPASFASTAVRVPNTAPAPLPDAVAYQLNRLHTGAIAATGFGLPFKQAWQANLSFTGGYHDITYPLIVRGNVYLGGGDLFAISGATGAKIWEKDIGSIGLAYDNDRLFAVSSSGLMTGFQLDGQQQWTRQLQYQWSFTSPPTAGNGMVYTGGAGSGGTVYAVSETTGKLAWTGQVENGDDSSPVVTSSGVYVAYVGPQTYDFNPLTGKQIWHYNPGTEGGGGATPVLFGGKLYTESWASSPNGLIIDALTGKPQGSFSSSMTPAIAHDIAYYVENNGSAGGSTLAAVDTRNNNVLWTTSTQNTSISVPPIVLEGTAQGDLIVCGTSNAKLYVFSEHGGKLMQTVTLPRSGSSYYGVQGGLSFSNGLLVVPIGSKLFGLRLS